MDITFRQVMDWLGDEDFLDDGIIYNDKPMELGTLIISTNVGGGALAKDIKLSYWGGVPFKKLMGIWKTFIGTVCFITNIKNFLMYMRTSVFIKI